MSLTDRNAVVAGLEANLRDVERALAHVDEARATQRPSPDRWSILEVMEHLAVVERGVGRAVVGAAGAPPSGLNTVEKNHLVAALETDPEKTEAPGFVRPKMRFGSLAGALHAFRESRGVTLVLAHTLDVPWDQHHAPHKLLGPLDIGQWFLFAASHGGRHVRQIEELTSTLPPSAAVAPPSHP